MIHNDDMIPGILAVCPSFGPIYDAVAADYADEDDAPPVYVALGDLARHLVGMLERGETEGLRAVFHVVEDWHLKGNDFVKQAATVGLLENLQNDNQHTAATTPEDFLPFLLPETRYWWGRVEAFWHDGTLIADDRDGR